MSRSGRHQQHQDAVRVYKGVTVFDWDHEPTDMRPSAFVESTQYDAVWAPSTQTRASMLESRRPRPPRKRGGLGTLGVVGVLAVATLLGVGLGWWHLRSEREAAAPVAAPPMAATVPAARR